MTKVVKIARVLVIDPNVATAKMMANLLRTLWPTIEVYGARNAEDAMMLCAEVKPQLVFVEAYGPQLDGAGFTKALRHSALDVREVPIIMISSDATAGLVTGARDAGAHEFMRRPYTMGELQQRLAAAAGRPRDWIEAKEYIGPDRRRFNSGDYKGQRKRRNDKKTPAKA